MCFSNILFFLYVLFVVDYMELVLECGGKNMAMSCTYLYFDTTFLEGSHCI